MSANRTSMDKSPKPTLKPTAEVETESPKESTTSPRNSIPLTISALTALPPAQPHIFLSGYEEFRKFANKLKKDGKDYDFYFSGTKNDKGENWCSDCSSAEPTIKRAVNQFVDRNDNNTFVHVDVGDRTFWKDMNNQFRLDKDIHLTVIPTLLRWKAPQRLEGSQLLNWELLDLYYNDE